MEPLYVELVAGGNPWADKLAKMNKSPLAIASLNSRLSQRGDKKRRKLKKRKNRIKVLTVQMEAVRLEQKGVKEGQRQVRAKDEAVEAECERLRRETALIIQQSAATQIRLALMFQILKAKENKDFTKAAQLAQALRELVVE